MLELRKFNNFINSNFFKQGFELRQPLNMEEIFSEKIVSLEDLNYLLSNEILTFPQIRLVNESTPYLNGYSGFLKQNYSELGGAFPKIRKNILFPLLKNGSTLVIDRCQNFFVNIKNICVLLESIFQCKISANLYYCFSSISTSFGMHFDDHDIISVQILGAKKWYLSKPTVSNPMPKNKSFFYEKPIKKENDVVIVNNSGGCIFIPRGYWHSVSSAESPNLHISFVIDRPRKLDLLKIILEKLELRENFRAPLYLAEYKEDEVSKIIEEAIDYLKSVDKEYFFNYINSDLYYSSQEKFDILKLR